MTRDEMAGIAVRVLAAQAKAWLIAHPEIIAEARAKAAKLGYVADI